MFQIQSFLMEKVIKNKKGPATSDQTHIGFQSKFPKNVLLVIYYLTKFDGKMLSGFWVIPKFSSATLRKPIHP